MILQDSVKLLNYGMIEIIIWLELTLKPTVLIHLESLLGYLNRLVKLIKIYFQIKVNKSTFFIFQGGRRTKFRNILSTQIQKPISFFRWNEARV